MNEKDEFIVKLGGRKAYAKKLKELCRQQRLINLEIEQLIHDAYEADEVIRDLTEAEKDRQMHIGVFQLDVYAGGGYCKESPYGLHAVSNFHSHNTECKWCGKKLEDFYFNDLTQVGAWRSRSGN